MHPWEELERAVRQERSEESWAIVERLRKQQERADRRRASFGIALKVLAGAAVLGLGSVAPFIVSARQVTRQPFVQHIHAGTYGDFCAQPPCTIDAGAVTRGDVQVRWPPHITVKAETSTGTTSVPAGSTCTCAADSPKASASCSISVSGTTATVQTSPPGTVAKVVCFR